MQQVLACPACLEQLNAVHDKRIGDFLFCCNCGGVYPVRHGVPHLIDLRAVLRLSDESLAIWHITQQRAVALYQTNDLASCSLGTREDVQIFRQFLHLRNKIVLDVGSGSFMLPGYVEAMGFKDYVGIDPIPALNAPNFPLLVGLAEMLPFRNDTFDTVILATTLDHVLDINGTVMEIRRVLQPDGEVYFWGALFYDPAVLGQAVHSLLFPRMFGSSPIEPEHAVSTYLRTQAAYEAAVQRIEANRATYEPLLVDQYHFRHLTREALLDAFGMVDLWPADETRISRTALEETTCIHFVKRPPSYWLHRYSIALRQEAHDIRQQVQAVQREVRETRQVIQDIGPERIQAAIEAALMLRAFLSPLRRFKRFLRWLSQPLLSPLRWFVQFLHWVRSILRLTRQALFVATISVPALFSWRKRLTGHGRRVLMLTISQIDIDPRINKVARTLADNEYEVDVLCYQNQAGITTVQEEIVQPGVCYVRVPRDPKWQGQRLGFFYQEPFRRVGLRRSYDYVHANDLTTLLVGWILARVRTVPLVYDAHEMWSENVAYNGQEWVPMPDWVRTLARYYEGFLVRYVDLFLTVSHSIRAEYQRRYKLRWPPCLLANYPELTLVNNNRSQKAPSIRELCGLSANRFVTLYLGGVNPLRNIENVVKAHTHLPEACVFVIRGPGIDYYRPQFEALAQELGLAQRIFCLPPVPMGDVIAGAAGADCGIVMLRNICKNFYWFYPNKFFEYMLAGLPVAVSNFPDVMTHVEKEKCGVVFDPDSPRSIAEAIQWLYEHPEAARAMGHRGQEGVFREYNWEAATQSLLDEYSKL